MALANLKNLRKKWFFIFILCLVLMFLSPFLAFAEWTDVSSSFNVVRTRPLYDFVAKDTYCDITLTNISGQIYQAPIRLVIVGITNSQVTVRNADGTTNDGRPYFNYGSMFGADNRAETNETSSPRQIRFFNPNKFRFDFSTEVRVEAELPPNQRPISNAGENQTIQLSSGQTSVIVQLDGSRSNDPDGTIVSYVWTGNPDPADVVNPSVTLSAGSYTFTLVVTDNRGASSDPSAVTVTVLSPPQNKPPIANAGTNRTVILPPGQNAINVQLSGSGTDPDGTIVAYLWNGTPDPQDIQNPVVSLGEGSHVFSLVVRDNLGAESEPSLVTIQVNRANPPVLRVSSLNYTINQGQEVRIEVSAIDPDGEPVTLSATPVLANASFSATPGTNARGIFTFIPDSTQLGNHFINFKARDPLGLNDSKTVQINVNKVNRPPELIVPVSASVDEGKVLTLQVQASDPNGDIVTLSASNLPNNAIFIGSTGTLTFAPNYNQAGIYQVTFTASDGQLSTSKTIPITVNDVPTGGTGQPIELTLQVDPVESPTFLSTQRITGTVNVTGGVPTVPKIKSALVTGMSPTTGEQGQTLTVTLIGQASGDYATHFAANVSQANFGTGITVNSIQVMTPTQASISITIAPNASEGPRSVSITTGGEVAVSVLAFNVTKGKSTIKGKLVTKDTGQPIAGAIVSIQGTSLQTVTLSDGSFTLLNVPSGNQNLIINAQDHEFVITPINAQTGVAIDFGVIETRATVFDPSSAPSISIGGLLNRGFNNEKRIKSLEEGKQLVRDAVLLVGREDIGLLDEYGNQENPNISGRPFMSIGKDASETLAMRTLAGESRSLGELLHTFTVLWQWENGPPKLTQWLSAIQEVVNRAWNNPNDPQNALFILLFNQGASLSPIPPQIVPDIRFNAIQAHLAELTLLLAATRTVDPKLIHDQVVTKYPELARSLEIDRSTFPLLAQAGNDPPQLTPVAKAERNNYTAQPNKRVMLRAIEVNYNPDQLTYSWTVLKKPAGSTSSTLLENDNQRTCYFTGDATGSYEIRLIVRVGDKESEPFDLTVVVDNPCIWGEERSWQNADASWNSVLCNFANQVPVTIAQQIPSGLFSEMLKGVMPLATFDAKMKALNDLNTFLDLNDYKYTQSKIEASNVYSKHFPEILNAAKADATFFSKFKTFAVNQMVEGLKNFVEGQISQVAKDIMYGILDKMIDVYIDSLRPASPFIKKAEVVEIEGIGRKGVLVTFERSPSDKGETESGTWHFYYSLWRYSADGMTRLFIGKEGKLPGPLVTPDNKMVLTYLDPSPPEGHNAYYVQARRIMGGPVITEEWNEAQFWTEQLLNTVQPPFANVYTYVKAFSDRVLYFYKALKLQDSDLSEPERIYVPKPFETPPPPVSLASTKEFGPYNGDVLISVPIFNSIFRLKGTKIEYLLSCGFKDPYQVGIAVDSHGHIYSDNSASDAMFGGRIFRWKPYTLERELFGSVQYFSQLLMYARPCAVQGLTSGWVGNGEKLFIADLYSNMILALEIPPGGGLPPVPNHYVSQPLPMPEGLVLTRNTSMTVNPLKGELLVTAGDNILRYNSFWTDYLFPDFAKPFTNIVGVDLDKYGTLYISDAYAGTITAIPSEKQNSLFYEKLINDPATRSLYTLRANINTAGELRLTGDHRSMVWFDRYGYHNRVFGISARVIDLHGNPLVGANVSCSDRGETKSALTDQYGVFHLPGLLLEGFPLQVGLLIRSADGKSGTYIAKMRDRGETFMEITFIPDEVPSQPPIIPDNPLSMPIIKVDIPLQGQCFPVYPYCDPDFPEWHPVSEIGVDLIELPPPPIIPGELKPRAPRIEVITPVDGMRTDKEDICVFGYVDDPSVTQISLYHNGVGQTIPVKNHRFGYPIKLRLGLNHIQAKATVYLGGDPLEGISKPVLVFRTNDIPTVGTISGIVKDKRSGYPLPDTLIRIQGTKLETYTNELGIWNIKEVPLGQVNIEVIP